VNKYSAITKKRFLNITVLKAEVNVHLMFFAVKIYRYLSIFNFLITLKNVWLVLHDMLHKVLEFHRILIKFLEIALNFMNC